MIPSGGENAIAQHVINKKHAHHSWANASKTRPCWVLFLFVIGNGSCSLPSSLLWRWQPEGCRLCMHYTSMHIGYALSSEEHSAPKLIALSRQAEEAGFSFLFISDHFHPWIGFQGQSPFVWSVLGGISQVTRTIRVGTGVTCPLIRTHPAIIAHAAATTASLFEERFMLGLGTGEHLNEHIVGQGWPPAQTRQEMLQEAVDIIRMLWEGKQQSYWGDYYKLEDARLYSLPKNPPPIYIAASAPGTASFAGTSGDGLIATSPDKDLLHMFKTSGGNDKPTYGQLAVCYDEDKERALHTAYQWWPIAALKGPLHQELRLPSYFENACATVRPEDIQKLVVSGPDPAPYLNAINEYASAGFSNIYLHQIGPNQKAFFEFFARTLLPALR